MTNDIMTTIAKGLDVSEISTGKGFRHARVIDTRCENGLARPIEECVLKRLNNHFIDYMQLPINFSDVGPCQEVHLCETVRDCDEDTLIIADDLSQLSALLNIYSINFKSNAFYIVETGKGEVIKPLFDDLLEPVQAQSARFGTFGS